MELGVGYTRTLPLYPLFDLRLHGNYKRIHRTGVVEFLPEHEERFDFYELKPSLSRFFGSDKLTLGLTYVFMDIPNLPGGGNPALSERSHLIRGAELGYALYSPLVLPSLSVGSLYGHRTPTRGWYFWAGFAQSDQVYGLRTVTDRDYYLGTRFEGPGAYDFTLQGTLYTSNTKAVDPNDPALPERSDPTQSFKSFRTSVIVQRRLIDSDATPGLGASALGFMPDMLNLVIPISWDKSLQGPRNFLPSDTEDHGDDYENVRAGIELWFKVFTTGLWGPALLFTAGCDVQYFYNLKRTEHLARANVRLGWGDFL
jgi:hypothetical protein